MRLCCDYDTLVANLTDVSSVVEDKLLNEDLKNVIFSLSERGSSIIGFNNLILFRRKLVEEYFTYEGEDCFIQLKSKELLDFLNSYRGVRKTKVEEVSFETSNKGAILCKVLETDTENDGKTISSWTFTNIPIKPAVMQQLDRQKPDMELETVDSRSILFYTRTLGSLLQAGTNLYSNLIFGESHVVVFSTAHMSFMTNILSDTFKGVKMSYRAVGFMDKVLCNEPMVNVCRLDTDLYFETETSQAFIRYDTRISDYQAYLDIYKEDCGLVIDRIYLRDIIKRLRLMNDAVEFIIQPEDSSIILRNTKFEQSIPILNSKGIEGIEKKKFKIMPEVLDKAILGSDDEFSSELFLYYCQQQNKTAVLEFTDNSKGWFSSVNIKPY